MLFLIEMKKATEKEVYFTESEREIISNFIKKIIIFKFSPDSLIFMVWLHNVSCRIGYCITYLDFRDGNDLNRSKSAKHEHFLYRT